MEQLLRYGLYDYLRNVDHAIKVLESSQEPLNLNCWRYENPESGTLYCAGGLLATIPFFNMQGMITSSYNGAPIPSFTATLGGYGQITTSEGIDVPKDRVAFHNTVHPSSTDPLPDGLRITKFHFILDLLFGPNAFAKYFAVYGVGWDDVRLLHKQPKMSHKELALARFKAGSASMHATVAY